MKAGASPTRKPSCKRSSMLRSGAWPAREKEQLEEKQRVETKRMAHEKALESLLAELEMEEEAATVAKKMPKKGK